MLRIEWQNQTHDIRRLIVRNGHERSFDHRVAKLAADHHLELAHEDSEPRPGDFWIGTHPHAGWGRADARCIAWASLLEVPLALHVLRQAERTTRSVEPDDPNYVLRSA